MLVEALSALVILSILVEITTNIVKSAFPLIKGDKSRIIALLLGITLAFSTGLGILNQLNIAVRFPWIDYLLTGIIISRGSNAFHDLNQFFQERKHT